MGRSVRTWLGVAAAAGMLATGAVVAAGAGSATAEAGVAEAAVAGPCFREQAQIRSVPSRIERAWADNDADGVAAVFTEDTDFVIGEGTFLRGREELRQYMADAYAGPLAGTRVTAPVQSVRCLSSSVAAVHTLGGILMPGETEVPPERQGVQAFIVTRHGADWLVDVYQNTRIK